MSERQKCPACEGRKHVKRYRIHPYGQRRHLYWCGYCDRFNGAIGWYSKKTARQQARATALQEEGS